MPSCVQFMHGLGGYKRNATCDLYTAEHKTSTAGLRREQFLPLVIPTEGIVHGDWLGIFIKLCSKIMEHSGKRFPLDRCSLHPLLMEDGASVHSARVRRQLG